MEDRLSKTIAISSIVRALAKVGDVKQALEVAQKMEDPRSKVTILNRIVATALANEGDKAQALDILKQALEVAQQIEDPQSKAGVLAPIVLGLVEVGDKAQALATLKQAVEMAQEIEDPGSKIAVLSDMAQALARAGEFKQALVVAQKIEVPGIKKSLLIRSLLRNIAMIFSTGTSIDTTRDLLLSSSRMKQTFTPAEKQLAKDLVELMQEK
jgi:tetratricopeptide (TPR) repeat protein